MSVRELIEMLEGFDGDMMVRLDLEEGLAPVEVVEEYEGDLVLG